MSEKNWVVSVGETYKDIDGSNLYEVIGVHFHWNTRNEILSKKVIQFVSYHTGFHYVLEQDEFIETRELLFSAEK